jgi:hypothetical protein
MKLNEHLAIILFIVEPFGVIFDKNDVFVVDGGVG